MNLDEPASLDLKIARISTVPHSLCILLRGQFEYLQKRGYRFHLVCSPGPGLEETAIAARAEYTEVELTRKITPIRDLKALIRLVGVFRKFKPDIVHSHSPKAGLLAMLAAVVCRVRLRVHTVAGMPLVEKTGAIRALLELMERLCYASAHFVIFNSPLQRQFALEQEWLPPGKATVLGSGSSNGIDSSFFSTGREIERHADTLRRELGIQESDVALLFLGRLAGTKGINELVTAFSVLNAKFRV